MMRTVWNVFHMNTIRVTTGYFQLDSNIPKVSYILIKYYFMAAEFSRRSGCYLGIIHHEEVNDREWPTDRRWTENGNW